VRSRPPRSDLEWYVSLCLQLHLILNVCVTASHYIAYSESVDHFLQLISAGHKLAFMVDELNDFKKHSRVGTTYAKWLWNKANRLYKNKGVNLIIILVIPDYNLQVVYLSILY
jgi:hypothetical protein